MKVATYDKPGLMIFDYKLDTVNDKESAVKWFADLMRHEFIVVKTVRLDDGKSFHDGTISRAVSSIPKALHDLEEYYDEIEDIAMSVIYKEYLLGLGISLVDGGISLSCGKSELAQAEELERLLGLV